MIQWMALVAAVKTCIPVFVIIAGVFGCLGIAIVACNRDRPVLLWWALPILYVIAVILAMILE